MEDSQVLEIPSQEEASHPVTPVNNNPPPVQQTPVVFKSATQEYSMGAPLADEAYDALGAETRGHYLVGMEPTRFLEAFLPWNADTPLPYMERRPDPTRIQSLTSVPPTQAQQKESHMYGKFVTALDSWVTATDTKQKLRFGHFARPDRYCGSMNVDVSTYWEDDFPVTSSCTFSLHQTHEEFKPDISHDAFAHDLDEGPEIVEVIDEEKRGIDSSLPATGDCNLNLNANAGTPPPSVDSNAAAKPAIEGTPTLRKSKATTSVTQVDKPKDEEPEEGLPKLISKVETQTQTGNHTRGQIAAYAGVAMSMAFRTHFFSMLIVGQYARFIRWDRRGAIVTRRFDYTANPHIVFGFYLRFGQLSPRQRGFDTNVEPLTAGLPPRVANAFNGYYHLSWYQGAKYGHKLDPSNRISASEMLFYRIQIEDRTQGRVDSFIIPAPAYKHSYIIPFSRASRRCLAYFDDPKAPKMCFLKDSWQEVSLRTAPEADIYRLLQSKNVPNIASMRLGDDVVDLETETQKLFYILSHSGRYKHLGAMVCHRLVMDTVARDLSTFTWCKVLLKCLADAVDASQAAYKAGVLHRDISAGNIMITVDEKTHELRGILIDWDMCLLLKHRNVGVNRTARTGTWAFISARLLKSAKSATPVIHSLSDDMESVFWVLIYQLLRYTRHDTKDAELYRLLNSLFNDAATSDNTVVGGKAKSWILSSCRNDMVSSDLTKFAKPELPEVLHRLGSVFYAPYALLAKQAKKKERLFSKSTKNATPTDHDEESNSSSDEIDEIPIKAMKNLDDPDEKWLSKYLRKAARTMEPLGVTPTGLLSPDLNSYPPKNPEEWRPALPEHHGVDFYHMWFVKNQNDTELAQSRHVAKVTSSMFNRMNGLPYSSGSAKRPLEDLEEEDKALKKHRPVS